jgi:DNA primase
VRHDYFNVKTVPERLQRLESDPWDGFFEVRQSITKDMMKKVGAP